MTDNGAQFSSQEFRSFSASNNIKHTTSSLLFPQSNGLAEHSVQTAKRLIRSSEDPYAALLAYRTTPLGNGKMATALHSYCIAGSSVQTFQLQENNYAQEYPTYLRLFRKKSYRSNSRNLVLIPITMPRSYQHCPSVAQSFCPMIAKRDISLVNQHATCISSQRLVGASRETGTISTCFQTPCVHPRNLTTPIPGETDTTSKTVQPPTNPQQPLNPPAPITLEPQHSHPVITHSGRVSGLLGKTQVWEGSGAKRLNCN